MLAVKIQVDFTHFDAKLRVLREPQKPIARALNRSIASGKTLAARLIAQDLGLAVSVVKEFVKTKDATQTNLSATLYASAKRIPLIDFKATGPEPSRQRAGGVTAKLKGGAGRYPHAFIATMRSGHRGVFQRNKGAGRLPIHEKHGPSIWKSYQRADAEVRARVQEQLAKNLSSEITYALSQAR
jgi:hypothetical protein